MVDLRSLQAAFAHRANSSLRLKNLISCLLVALAVLALSSAYRSDGGWLVDSKGQPVQRDFVNFYSAGMLVQQGRPADAYDWERHKEAQTALVGTHRSMFFPWPYPPIALPAAQILSLPSYQTSFVIFVAISLMLCASVAGLIVGTPSAALWVAASSATFFNIYLGQNGLVMAASFGFGLLVLPNRPILAGIVFGLLAFKPHLGLLLPFFLIALGQWRAFASAAATVAATVVLSLFLYGPVPWVSFIDQLGRVSGSSLTTSYDDAFKFQSVFGMLRWLGFSAGASMALHLAVAAASAAAALWLWRKDMPYTIKAAVLCTATAMISPYLFIYDLTILLIAQAFLMRHLFERHGDISSRMWLALLGLNGIILLFPFVEWPTGLIATIVLAGIVVTEAFRHGQEAANQQPVSTAGSPC